MASNARGHLVAAQARRGQLGRRLDGLVRILERKLKEIWSRSRLISGCLAGWLTNASSEAPRRPASLSIQSARNRSSSASSLASVDVVAHTGHCKPGTSPGRRWRGRPGRAGACGKGQITMDDLARRVVVVLAGLVVDRGEDEPKWRRRHTEGEWLA
jgi:hypothetical protein